MILKVMGMIPMNFSMFLKMMVRSPMNSYGCEDDEHDPSEPTRFLKMMLRIPMRSYFLKMMSVNPMNV